HAGRWPGERTTQGARPASAVRSIRVALALGRRPGHGVLEPLGRKQPYPHQMESERVADRLAVAAAAALVGRERERDRLRAWVVDRAGPSAVCVQGTAGIGKTALVTGTLAGRGTVVVDGREVEPTPATVLAHVGSELGLGTAASTVEQVAEAIEAA